MLRCNRGTLREKVGDYFLNADTEVVFVNVETTNNQVVVTTAAGYKTVAEQDVADLVIVYNKTSKVASKVMVLAEAEAAKDDVVNFYRVGYTGTNANDIAFALVTRAES